VSAGMMGTMIAPMVHGEARGPALQGRISLLVFDPCVMEDCQWEALYGYCFIRMAYGEVRMAMATVVNSFVRSNK
jgi:hypothetical protein